jgi:hypothetical protein
VCWIHVYMIINLISHWVTLYSCFSFISPICINIRHTIISTHSDSQWMVLRRVLSSMTSSPLTASHILASAVSIRKANPLKCQCWLLLTKLRFYQQSLYYSLQAMRLYFFLLKNQHWHIQYTYRCSSLILPTCSSIYTPSSGSNKHQY